MQIAICRSGKFTPSRAAPNVARIKTYALSDIKTAVRNSASFQEASAPFFVMTDQAYLIRAQYVPRNNIDSKWKIFKYYNQG